MPDKLPPFSPEQPAWLIAVKALIPADIPHILIFCRRVEVDGEKAATIGVACNCTLPFAQKLLMAAQAYVAADQAGD